MGVEAEIIRAVKTYRDNVLGPVEITIATVSADIEDAGRIVQQKAGIDLSRATDAEIEELTGAVARLREYRASLAALGTVRDMILGAALPR